MTECDCKDGLVKRLSRAFDVPCWVGNGWSVDVNTLASILCINDEDAELLCKAEIIDSERDMDGRVSSVHVRDVLTFIEKHGDWWWKLRMEKQAADLRRVVQRAERKAK